MMQTRKYDFDAPVNRIGTDSYKWDHEGEDGKYLPFGVADTDFKAPEEIVEAVRRKVDSGIFAYGWLPAERYNQSIAGWYRTRYGAELNTEWIHYAPGLMTGALWMLLHAFTRPGDKILLQPPTYGTFHVVIENMGRFTENNDLLLKEGRYEIDFEDLEKKAADPRVRILLICSPHNPVGRVWTREELVRMAEICKRTHTLLICDEIHGDIVYKGHRHIPFFTLGEEYTDNLIMMGSPSKTFNLASFYAGYVIIPNEYLMSQYKLMYEYFHCDCNMLGVEAAIAAYDRCAWFVDQQNAYFEKNIGVVRDFLKENMPEVKLIEPEATYLLWLDFRAWGMEDKKIAALCREHGVLINPGSNYGASGQGFMRLNIATQTAVLKKGLELILEARNSRKG